MIAIQFEARKIGLIAEYKKTQEHRDREFELANKCIALVQQKDQIDEEIDQIDANIISQQERHASQQQSFIDDQKRKGKNHQSNHTLVQFYPDVGGHRCPDSVQIYCAVSVCLNLKFSVGRIFECPDFEIELDFDRQTPHSNSGHNPDSAVCRRLI